jgi:hypothetical protein
MRSVFALLVLALPVLAAPVPKALKKAACDGTWKLVEYWSNSEQQTITKNMYVEWTLEGEALYIGPKGGTNTHWYLPIPDPTNPSVRRIYQVNDGNTQAARVEVDGDTLKFCIGKNGQSELTECAVAKGVSYYLFTRVKPNDPDVNPPK